MVTENEPRGFLPQPPWRELELLRQSINALSKRMDLLLQPAPSADTQPSPVQMVPVSAQPNRPSWIHSHHTTQTPGIPLPFPSVSVPDGFALVIRALPGNTRDIYLGRDRSKASDTLHRITLSPAEAVRLKITNADLVYQDVNVANEGSEYFVEQ